MPLYTFRCSGCGFFDEYLLGLRERDTTLLLCELCGEILTRKVDMPVLGKPSYQMKAVMASGEHVSGHFGKMAKKQ